MKRTFIAIVFLLFVVAACAKSEVVCPGGQVASDLSKCPGNTPQGAPATKPVTQEQPASGQATLDPAVQKLVDLHTTANIQSMSFLYAPITMGPTTAVTNPSHTYYIRGDKARIKVWTAKQNNPASNMDTVYLDFATEETHGFCMSKRLVDCSIEGDTRPANFDDFDIRRPLDWLDLIPPSAVVKAGASVSFQNRDCKVVRFEKDGDFYDIAIDQGLGVPLRVRIYSDAEFSKLISGVEYQEFMINTVRAEDVIPPTGGA